MNVFFAIYNKILRFPFIANANARKDLFIIKQNKVVVLLVMLKIVYNQGEEFVDYVMSHPFASLKIFSKIKLN